MFLEELREIVCDGCDDGFCQKRERDLLECISHYKEAWDIEH